MDHALTLFLADETEAALRWGAAALERDPLLPSALVVTSRLLDQMGRSRAAVDGMRLAVRRAVDLGDLPLALAAIDDLRILGADVGAQIDEVASAFCRGSDRLQLARPVSTALSFGDFSEPLSPFLAGPPLASRVTQILQAAKRAHEAAVGSDPPPLAPYPFFSTLSREALREVLGTFQMITVPAGHRLVQEGEEGDAAYIVAHGEVEISRRLPGGDSKPTLGLTRLGSGSFFGELALISQLPSATTVTATRPSILLVAKRDLLVTIAARRAEVAVQLAAHCRRSSLANLGWTSPVVASVPAEERATLVERLQMQVFDRGEKLVRDGEEPKGLHLIVSGEVAIVARDWSERVLLATLGAGETVGEVELVLCRHAYADAIATRPTAVLFLARDEYSALVQDRPAILQGLYATAVRRHAETRLALEAGSATVTDDWLIEEEQTETRMLVEEARPVAHRVLPAPPHQVASREPKPRAPVYAAERVAAPSAPPAPFRSAPPPRSVAPLATSVRPPPQRSSSLRQTFSARLALTAGVALVASAAGVLGVLALRDRPTGGSAAAGTGEAVQPAAVAPPPQVTTPATVAERAPTVDAQRPVLRVKVAAPKPKPRSLTASAPTATASAPSASGVAAAPSAAPTSPQGGARLTSARALSSVDDFGGRE